jgi:hypothetical protein
LVLVTTFVFNNFSDGGLVNTIIGIVILGGTVLLALGWMSKMYFREVDGRGKKEVKGEK